MQNVFSDGGGVGAELTQHPDPKPIAFTDEAEQEMLCADVVVAELARLLQAEFEHLFGAGRERAAFFGADLWARDRVSDASPRGVQGDTQLAQAGGGHALALADQPEQQMFSADEIVTKETGLVLGQDHHPAGSLGEPVKHRAMFPPAGLCRSTRSPQSPHQRARSGPLAGSTKPRANRRRQLIDALWSSVPSEVPT